jgi:subtilisin family serine protease
MPLWRSRILGAGWLLALAIGIVAWLFWPRPQNTDIGPQLRNDTTPAVKTTYTTDSGATVTLEVFDDVVAVQGSAAARVSGNDLVDRIVLVEPFSALGYVVVTTSTSQGPALIRSLAAREPNVGLLGRMPTSGSPTGYVLVIVTPHVIVRRRATTDEMTFDQAVRGLQLQVDANLSAAGDRLYRLSVDDRDPLTAIAACARLLALPEVDGFARPSMIIEGDPRGLINPDPLEQDQWHLATMHAREAWSVTRGERSLVAVIDDAIRTDHEDLSSRLFRNQKEIPANHLDDDANGLVDDVAGWNFRDSRGERGAGSAIPYSGFEFAHGTQVAGLAVATCGNGSGGCGVAPGARLLPIAASLVAMRPEEMAAAVRYATSMNADVINASWGFRRGIEAFGDLVNAIEDATRNGRGGRGAVVVFALSNENYDNFSPQREISALPSVVSVGRSTDSDRWGRSGYGSGMSLLAPSGANLASDKRECVQEYAGVKEIVTTYLPTYAGDAESMPCGCNKTFTEGTVKGYTRCFSGTSASAPLVAGVAGLILSVKPTLSAADVRQILLRSADPIDAEVAGYVVNDGLRRSKTHGSGRINAYGAVRLARTWTPSTSHTVPSARPRPSRVPPRTIRGPYGVAPNSNPGVRSAETSTLVAGRPALSVRVPGQDSPMLVWRDVRVIRLRSGSSVTTLMSALPSGVRRLREFDWPADLLNGNVVVCEASASVWVQAQQAVDGLVSSGEIAALSRIAFTRASRGVHSVLAFNGFSAASRSSAAGDGSELATGESALSVHVEPNADVRVSASRAVDPLVVIEFARALVSRGIIVEKSIKFAWQ